MKWTEGKEQSYDAIRVCGGLPEIASAYGRSVTVKRFAHYLNDYSRVNLLHQVSGITSNL